MLITSLQPTYASAEIIVNFTTSLWSNVQSGAVIAYLNAAVETDGCSSVPVPQNSKNWILMLTGFDTCPLSKIAHAREAGYVMLFTYNQENSNDFISDKVEATGYPVVILSKEQALTLLQESSLYYPGTVYAKIAHNGNTTLLRITVYVEDNAARVTTLGAVVSDSSSMSLNGGEIAGIVIAMSVFFALLLVISLIVILVLVRHRKRVQAQGSQNLYKTDSTDNLTEQDKEECT